MGRLKHMMLTATLAGLFAAGAQAQNRAHPSLPLLGVPDGAGVNIHFTDAKAGEMKMLAEAGFRWVRMDFGWGGTEREKGKYDFSAFDRLMNSLDEHKIRALFILDYNNRHYDQGLSPYSEEGRQAFARWAAAAVQHFKGRGILWEMYNEPNISFWKPKPNVDDYIKLSQATGKAIRAVAPGECYFGAATSQIDLTFLEACFKAGVLEDWDAVSVHPYRQNDPETSAPEYRKLRLLIEKYKPKGKTIPILSGEWGYSTAWANFTDERQGKYLPRQWMTNLMNEVPLSIWYDWHDDGTDPKEAEHNFGTVENQYFAGRDPVYTPKQSYTAARAFTQFFNGYRYNKRLALRAPSSPPELFLDARDDYLLLFEKDSAIKLAAWTTKEAHEITIPASPGAFRVINHLGEVQPQVTAGAGGLKLRVSDAPLYLEPTAPNDILRVAAAWERLPLEVVVRAPALAGFTIKHTNPLPTDLFMRMEFPPGSFPRVDVPAGATTTRQIRTQRQRFHPEEPRPFRTELSINGNRIAQESDVVVTNPVRLVTLPRSDKALLARIENPSGEAFSSTLYGTYVGMSEKAQETRVPINLAEGETEKLITVPIEGNPPARYSVSLGLTQPGDASLGQPREMLSMTPAREFQPLIGFTSLTNTTVAQNYRVTPDGEANIVSEQNLSLFQPLAVSPGGGPTLKLAYRMEPGWKFLQIQPQSDALKKVEGQPKALGMWVYGDGSGNTFRMRFRDTSGQTFQPHGTQITWKGWKYFEFPIDANGGRWGGANDGQIHWPISLDTLALLDSNRRDDNKGEIYINSPVWVY